VQRERNVAILDRGCCRIIVLKSAGVFIQELDVATSKCSKSAYKMRTGAEFSGKPLLSTHVKSLSTNTSVLPPIAKSTGQSMNLCWPCRSPHVDESQVRTLVPMLLECFALSVIVRWTGESGLRKVQFTESALTHANSAPTESKKHFMVRARQVEDSSVRMRIDEQSQYASFFCVCTTVW